MDVEVLVRLQRVLGPEWERCLCVVRSVLPVWSGCLDEHLLL